MADRSGIFAGDDPFALARAWLAKAQEAEINDANAAALATVDARGLPNVRMVLLKAIEDEGFVFYTNYDSEKGHEMAVSGKVAMNLHWKSLRRQIRIRGHVAKTDARSIGCLLRLAALGQPHRRLGLKAIRATGQEIAAGEDRRAGSGETRCKPDATAKLGWLYHHTL